MSFSPLLTKFDRRSVGGVMPCSIDATLDIVLTVNSLTFMDMTLEHEKKTASYFCRLASSSASSVKYSLAQDQRALLQGNLPWPARHIQVKVATAQIMNQVVRTFDNEIR